MKTVAVIGLGNIATRHRRNLKHLFPETRLLAMSASGRVPGENVSDCDLVVSSIEEVIRQGAELVIIASPAPFHAQHAIPFLKAGIPTLIEKPVTACFEDSKKLIAIAEHTQTPVAVGYCLRYLPSSQVVKQLLESQSIGNLLNAQVEIGQYLPDWRPTKDYRETVSAKESLGGGALLELSHELDYTQWLLGNLEIQFAHLRSSTQLSLEVEDLVDTVAITDSGAVVSIHLDFLQRQAYRRCRFVGSQGTIEWDLIKNEVKQTLLTDTSVIYSEPDWDKNNMYLNMVLDFIAKTKGKQSNCVGLHQAAKTIELIETIKSGANHR
ncbi:Gfo/Idh/MocA family oxidoreductase [Vibrio sp. SCSIO 43140]|uniref:Gfo/Idh/MocA family protein n=1 Tax=Vibrio sp. SCSIO 43140 TaxID=2819100 RepID=UPI0020757328|nr:Gfo/Idh/MocA family oxidoreductase [Vibrio sp. SCSIO 43140]USD60249.1 Gfo/Idh/MocA family oxidoreductase [Vibrio sp. SCSIO 43140]